MKGESLGESDYKKYVLSYFLNMSKNRELSEELAGIAAYKHISGGESILEAGHRTNYICLVVSGLVRGFYIDEEGNDRTKCFSLQVSFYERMVCVSDPDDRTGKSE